MIKEDFKQFLRSHNAMRQDMTPDDGMTVDLRRYPNRRYYDSARSQHLTLEDIYRLVRDGYNVRVSDSKTGEDITARILAQLILEHDPPKLAAFPADLLHQIIRSNESLLRDFVEKYFSGALSAFLDSQREFDRYLGQTLGLYSLPAAGPNWAEAMMRPFLRSFFADGRAHPPQEPAPPSSQGDDELRKAVTDLQRQLAELQNKLDSK
jgi:polyhydroxyalkanoate synthesis repressor PhaR